MMSMKNTSDHLPEVKGAVSAQGTHLKEDLPIDNGAPIEDAAAGLQILDDEAPHDVSEVSPKSRSSPFSLVSY